MVFLKGRLYFRVLGGVVGELFYTTKDIPENYRIFNNNQIAKIGNRGKSEPLFAGFTELSRNGDFTVAGLLVEFREACIENLCEFFAIWNSEHSLAKWLDNVDQEAGLLIGEKQRLRNIVGEFLS